MESLASCQYQEKYLLEFFPLKGVDLRSEGSVHLADTPDSIKVDLDSTREDPSGQCDCACDC